MKFWVSRLACGRPHPPYGAPSASNQVVFPVTGLGVSKLVRALAGSCDTARMTAAPVATRAARRARGLLRRMFMGVLPGEMRRRSGPREIGAASHDADTSGLDGMGSRVRLTVL